MESVFAFWGKMLGAISERIRMLILIVLFDSATTGKVGSSSCTFSELQQIARIPKNALAYHLKILRETNLVKRKHVTRGAYELTNEGYDVLEALGITEELLRAYKTRKQ